MTRTITLYGRCSEVSASDAAELSVPWTEAANFHEMASHMIEGEYPDSVIIAVNSAHDPAGAAVRVTVDHAVTNFRGFTARFWLGDKPYSRASQDGDLPSFDFDWVAFIPCSSHLTG